MNPERIVIIADDLTGACDSAVAFVASGRSVRVVLEEADFDAAGQDVLAFTTETRDLLATQAGELVARRVTAFGFDLGRTLLFKKVDSAARGNFGAEIASALRASRASLALVAPAFPDAGRTMDAGVLTIRDWSGQDTAIALRDRFPKDCAKGMEVLPVGSEEHLEQGIARALSNGTRILLCDGATQTDLERLAAAGLGMHQPLLWAGSAGLAHALASKTATLTEKAAVPISQCRGRVLLFVGTSHAVTSLQVEHLRQASGGRDRLVRWIPSVPASNEDVIATFATAAVGGLILTGGDTASFVLRALQASSIRLGGEVARGIPWGFVEGGLADGCVVVTKSGGFGEREALVEAFEFCERRLCDPT